MRNGTFYLNSTGTRWVVFINGKREQRTFETKSGKIITRTVNHYTQWGNFATCNISYKGKKINVFSDAKLSD